MRSSCSTAAICRNGHNAIATARSPNRRGRSRAGYFETGKGPLLTRAKFGDVQLHVEWATPAIIAGNSQGRGNSGVFLMGRYEIQVLDSYNNPTYADGQAGAIYGR